MKKATALLLAVLILAMAFSGCAASGSTAKQSSVAATSAQTSGSGSVAEQSSAAAASAQTSGSDSTANSSGKYTIGFCNYTETMDFFTSVRDSMQRACDKNGVKLIYAVSNHDPTAMRSAWDSFVTQGANIIVDFSVLSDSGSSMAKEFKETHKIDVISVDNVYDNAYFFGVNNKAAGETAGKYLAEMIQKKWNGQCDCMLQFYSETNGDVVKLRNSGIYDAMVDAGISLPEDKVTWLNAAPSGTPDPATMKSLVTDYLTAHPNEHHIAIGCFNDDGGNAAYSAAKASNRLNDVMIVSHNADKVALDVLREGDSAWVGTVNYNSDKYGDQIVDMALKILSGAKVDNQVYAYTNIVNADNVNELFPK